jgi:arylsulfatase A-like enzyme
VSSNRSTKYLFPLIFVFMSSGLISCSSQNDQVADQSTTPNAPNILLIVADDLGYSDLGEYGGEINTPTLDSLAKQGVKFSNFYSAPICSFTRAMLLSGVDNHLSGLGGFDSEGVGLGTVQVGYEGYLNFRVASIAELLQDAGYHTIMTGKWHLGLEEDQVPHSRGFEQTYVMPRGSSSHYSKMAASSKVPTTVYLENGVEVELPEDFFSTKTFTDKMIEYLDNIDDDKPFFAFTSYTAPHWPLQAPDEFIEKYMGRYDVGYDVIMNERLQRMLDLGLISEIPEEFPRSPFALNWEGLNQNQREKEAKNMAVYAAMIETMDVHINRIIDNLRSSGKLENTLIIFMSDNGADGNDPYHIEDNVNWIPATYTTDTDSLGKPGSFTAYGPAWAAVSSAPYKLHKAFPTEGGIKVPAFMVWPGEIAAKDSFDNGFMTVLDIVPTLLDVSGSSYPGGIYRGRNLFPLQGRSLLPYLTGKQDQLDDQYVMGWELFGRKAIRNGDWKIINNNKPFGESKWELYNISLDPFERDDLSARDPEKLSEMIGLWDEYAKTNGVIENGYVDVPYSNKNEHYKR